MATLPFSALSLPPGQSRTPARGFCPKCSLSIPPEGPSRRCVSISLVLCHFFSLEEGAKAGNILDKYVKRKKLEPLEAYVPAVILSQSQLKDLGTLVDHLGLVNNMFLTVELLDFGEPKYTNCRSLLRSGPAASLRVNIRAVAQYASEDGKGKIASDSVDQCLRALGDLDSLLLHASRSDPSASVESMTAKINVAVLALDSLLQTVPVEVVNKARAIADAYMTERVQLLEQEDDRISEKLDPEIKKLEELL